MLVRKTEVRIAHMEVPQMRLNLRPALRALTVSAALLAVPSLAGASFIVGPSHVGVSPDHGGRFNPISFNPTSVLINLQVNHTGTGSFKIIEPGYNGKFTGRVNCILPIGKPHLEIKGDTGTITVPKQL